MSIRWAVLEESELVIDNEYTGTAQAGIEYEGELYGKNANMSFAIYALDSNYSIAMMTEDLIMWNTSHSWTEAGTIYVYSMLDIPTVLTTNVSGKFDHANNHYAFQFIGSRLHIDNTTMTMNITDPLLPNTNNTANNPTNNGTVAGTAIGSGTNNITIPLNKTSRIQVASSVNVSYIAIFQLSGNRMYK